MKIGGDTTLLLNRGKVQENSSEILNTKIYYTSIPLFIGYNFNVLDTGNFYMGPGISYFIARGRINSSVSGLSDDIDASAWGFGFIAGIEYKLLIKIHCYFEWEYFDARSEPVLQAQSAHNWDDFYIDFSGNRLLFGIRYYLL
jgi:opacity protein-like surface antigen